MPKTSREKEYRSTAERRNRAYIQQYKELHECEDCGETRTILLDFHHISPKDKVFEISDARNRSFKSLEAEIKKCRVLCANCHRIVHAEERLQKIATAQDEELFPLFDASAA